MTTPKTKPLGLDGQLRVQRLKSFCNSPIIGDSRAKSQPLSAKYQQILDIFRHSGGHDEAEIYLTHWGVSPIIKDLLLVYAEYDALMSGVCDV
ncbi:MAG: hypothetical protein ACLBM6_09720 [Cuspidothrix sp.]|jgi:hypothetical protein